MDKDNIPDNTGFFGQVSADADELISRTVHRATGKHFSETIELGKPPPLSLMLKAYWVSGCFHSGRRVGKIFRQAGATEAASSPKESGQKNGKAEILDADGGVIGHTDISFD